MATATANPPIYQLLVEEHGDVLAATRDAARETRRAASAALDWSDLRPARGALEHGRTEQGRTEHGRTEHGGDAPRERVRENARTSAPDHAPERAAESERGHDDATPGTGAPENAPAEAGASTGTPAAGTSAAGTGTDWFDRSEQPEPAAH